LLWALPNPSGHKCSLSIQIVFSFLLPLSSVSNMRIYVVIDMETTDIPSIMRLQEPLLCFVNAPMVNVISVWGCLVSAYSAIGA
jgi:hypothetical protein